MYDGLGAKVPADSVKVIHGKPALFAYHTHPVGSGAQWPSPEDLAAAILDTFRGRFAAHVVISPDVIYVYGLSATRTFQLLDDPNPYLAALRLENDVYNAFAAMRSYADFYPVFEMERLAEKFGLVFMQYPLDSFARTQYLQLHRTSQAVDFDAAEVRLQRLREAAAKGKRLSRSSAA